VIEAVVFDAFGTLLQLGVRRHPFRQLMRQLRLQGRRPDPEDARTLMTRNLGLAGAANSFGAQISHAELAGIERDLFVELQSIRLFDDSLEALNKIRAAGLKIAICSNLAAPYAVPIRLLLPELDYYVFSFEVESIKPEPEIYQKTIDLLGCEASAIAMIGDTAAADMHGPIAQGMQGYLLQRNVAASGGGFRSLLEFAEYVCRFNR